jgi:DNA polymerase I-like protein with 3'-5' exonuclease and polymerase domains
MSTFVIDAEYGHRGGAEYPSAFEPVVFCAIDLDTGERLSFHGRDPRLARFINHHRNDLFISHNLVAEVMYLLRLGITPPTRWFDTMLGWRYVTNTRPPVPSFKLEKILVETGIPHRYAGEKDRLQDWIGNLEFNRDSPDDLRLIRDYCFADCEATAALYHRLVGRVPAVWMSYATAFCLELARMELRGIALDMPRYRAIQERKDEVVERVVAGVNTIHSVFIDGRLSRERFFGWCAANGIGWPARRSPATGRMMLPLDQDTFSLMKDRHPFIGLVHEANKTVKHLNSRELIVDPTTGRHYPGNIPFAQATSRTSPRKSIFGAPKWMRWLIVPTSPEHVVIVIDYDAEEVLIAAHLSGDAGMMHGYVSTDPHMAFAILAGAAPPWATKKTHGRVRQKYKAVNLGVSYGQTAHGLAISMGVHPDEARAHLAQHRRTYPVYWDWVRRYTTRAFRTGRCFTAAGWPRVVAMDDNPRSVGNFPVQGTGGDLMRLTAYYLSRWGLQLLATIHDGFLVECHRDQLPEVRECIDAAFRQATGQLLPDAPMSWTPTEFFDRYRDDGGKDLWEQIDQVITTPKRKGVFLR